MVAADATNFGVTGTLGGALMMFLIVVTSFAVAVWKGRSEINPSEQTVNTTETYRSLLAVQIGNSLSEQSLNELKSLWMRPTNKLASHCIHRVMRNTHRGTQARPSVAQ